MNNKTQKKENRYKIKKQNKTVKERILGEFVSRDTTGALWRPRKSVEYIKNNKCRIYIKNKAGDTSKILRKPISAPTTE